MCFGFTTMVAQEVTDDMVEIFFEKFKNEGSTVALDYVYSTNKWVSQSSDDS